MPLSASFVKAHMSPAALGKLRQDLARFSAPSLRLCADSVSTANVKILTLVLTRESDVRF